LLPKGDSLGKVVLFSVDVADESPLSSVDVADESPLSSVDVADDVESTLGGSKSVGGELLLSSLDPVSDDESLLSSVDPVSDVPSLLSVDPLAYMIAEVGETIEIIIKNINEILIRFIVAIAMTLYIKPLS